MAKYKLTGPDGQSYEVTAPDDATEDQVMSYFKAAQSQKPESPGVGQMTQQMVGGMKLPLQAVKQAYLKYFGAPEESQAYDETLKQQAAQAARYGPTGAIARGAGSLITTAPMMALPGGEAMVPRILAGATQGGIQGILNPATGEGDFAKQKLVQGGEGAAAGGLLAGVLGAGVKGFNALRGKFQTPQEEALYTAGKAMDVPLSYGDISKNPMARGLETINEYIPFSGMAPFRKLQGQKAQAAAEKGVTSFSNGIDDVGPAIKANMEKTLEARKQTANTLYRQVDMALAQPGVLNKVEPNNLRSEVSNLLSDYPDIFERKGLEAYPLKAKLQSIMQGLDTQTAAQLKGRMSAKEYQDWIAGKGEQIPLKFEDARWLRDQIGEFIDRAKNAAGATGSKELRALTSVKGALDKDINAFGDSLPQNAPVTQAYRNANEYYKNYLGPFNDPVIAKSMRPESNVDEIFNTFIKQDIRKMTGKNQAQKLVDVTTEEPGVAAINKPNGYSAWNANSPDGRDAINAGILQSSFNRAHKDEIFSPKMFANELDKFTKSGEASFSADQQEQVKGLIKIMHAAEKGGQYLGNPPTGARSLYNQYSPYMLGPAAVAAPVTTGLTLEGARVMTRLLTSDSGKRLLLAANKIDVDSPSMKILLDAARSTALRGGAQATVQTFK